MKVSFKQLILVGFVLLLLEVSAFFTVNVALPPDSHIFSAIGMLVLALPAFVAAVKWLGWERGSTLIAILGAYALLIETAAIMTGFPYGHFGYSEHLGYKLFGQVPWTVAFGWSPLMLAAGGIAMRLSDRATVRIPVIAIILVAFDIVLDPGAVKLNFWRYPTGGAFYGVPLSNFGGWVISGTIGAIIWEGLVRTFKPLLPAPAQLTQSAGLTLFFWTSIAAFGGLIIPAVFGALSLVALAAFYLKYHYPYDDMIVLVDEDNTPIATAPKLATHDADTPLHRAFSIFLFNKKGELLLQQRALTKKTWPGAWSNSCCGHLMLDEKLENAAKRRVKDELGMTGINPIVTLPDFRYRAEKDGVVENEICPVMVAFTEQQPVIEPTEVNAVRWVDWYEFLEMLKHPDSGFSPWAIEENRAPGGRSDIQAEFSRLHRPVRLS